MARYVVKGRLTSTDSENISFIATDNVEAQEIFFDYLNSGKMAVLQDVIEEDQRILWLSYENVDALNEVRSKLDALGDYLRPDITWEILSEG